MEVVAGGGVVFGGGVSLVERCFANIPYFCFLALFWVLSFWAPRLLVIFWGRWFLWGFSNLEG